MKMRSLACGLLAGGMLLCMGMGIGEEARKPYDLGSFRVTVPARWEESADPADPPLSPEGGTAAYWFELVPGGDGAGWAMVLAAEPEAFLSMLYVGRYMDRDELTIEKVYEAMLAHPELLDEGVEVEIRMAAGRETVFAWGLGEEGFAAAVAIFRAGEEMGIAAVHASLDGEAQADRLLMDMLESVQVISEE